MLLIILQALSHKDWQANSQLNAQRLKPAWCWALSHFWLQRRQNHNHSLSGWQLWVYCDRPCNWAVLHHWWWRPKSSPTDHFTLWTQWRESVFCSYNSQTLGSCGRQLWSEEIFPLDPLLRLKYWQTWLNRPFSLRWWWDLARKNEDQMHIDPLPYSRTCDIWVQDNWETINHLHRGLSLLWRCWEVFWRRRQNETRKYCKVPRISKSKGNPLLRTWVCKRHI